MELRVGCVGYSYDFWVGPFYPRHTSQSDFLHLYGKVFDLVEIDSTFYHIPAPEVAHGWRRTVPPNFLFAAKFPRVVTHEQALGGPKGPIDAFLRAIEELRPKIGPLVLQLPPAFEVRGGRERLLGFLDSLPTDQRYAVEFRHDSWMQARIFEELRRRDVAMVWNETQYLDTMPEVTTDFLYLRFIGDRSLDRLGTIQIDRTKEMERWVERLRRVEGDVRRAYVLFNNHFAGFGPACADAFRRQLGLPGLELAAIHEPDPGQSFLQDFEGPGPRSGL